MWAQVTNDRAFERLWINFLTNDKILDWSKLKAFVDKLKFVLGWVKHIVRKGENAGFQHFLLFPQCFQKAFFLWLLKVGIVC